MKNKGQIIGGSILIGAIAALLLILPKFQISENSQTLGSVVVGNEYNATTTRDQAGTAMTTRALKNGAGAFGSLIVTGAGAGVIEFYDATTTPATPIRLLATVPASAAAGTYIFDVYFTTGLYMTISGTAPTSTVTWR